MLRRAVLPLFLTFAALATTPGADPELPRIVEPAKATAHVDVRMRLSIVDAGVTAGNEKPATAAIQQAIELIASSGGGTLVIPAGRFLTGALYLKPGVDLHLEKDAILAGSTNEEDYPTVKTRIEGHTQEWCPALVNAIHCPGVRITGEGTIEGGGKPFWDRFWERYAADKRTRNLDVYRPRNLFLQDCDGARLSGISLRGSGFWNLHLYRSKGIIVDGLDIRTPTRAPSTDGIDVDSCQDVIIRNCFISVDDDNIAMKGTKGTSADQDKDSPAVERVLVTNCTFGLGYGVVTLGSEACHVRDITVRDCRVEGPDRNCLIRLKLRPDTPQRYEQLLFTNITLAARGKIVSVEPWTQYFDLKGLPPPAQVVDGLTISRIQGRSSTFGRIAGPGKATIRNVTFEDVNLTLDDPSVVIRGVENLNLRKLVLNNREITAADVDVPSSPSNRPTATR